MKDRNCVRSVTMTLHYSPIQILKFGIGEALGELGGRAAKIRACEKKMPPAESLIISPQGLLPPGGVGMILNWCHTFPGQ